MTLNKSFCTIAYRNQPDSTFDEIFSDLAAAEYNGAEIWWPHIEGLSENQLQETAAAASDKGIVIPMVSPYLGNYNLEMNNADEMLERTKAAAPAAAALNAPLLRAFAGWTCECSSLTASDEYWDYNLKGFKEMAVIADNYGLDIAIETHSGTLADSVEGVFRFAEFCGPRIKVNLQLDDIISNSKLENGLEVYDQLKDLTVHGHVPTIPEDSLQAEWHSIAGRMAKNGFSGFLSIENCSGKGVPAEIAQTGMQTLKGLLDE